MKKIKFLLIAIFTFAGCDQNSKNVQRIEFPDCGHLIPLENPNEFATHLNQFVKKLS